MVQYALIVAGGKGLRMGTELPKQFLPIGGKPVLMRTLEAFYDYNAEIRIILVLPHSQQDYWRQLCREYCFSLPHAIADGGETRFHSVKNGLALVKTPALVGVHDGVRIRSRSVRTGRGTVRVRPGNRSGMCHRLWSGCILHGAVWQSRRRYLHEGSRRWC